MVDDFVYNSMLVIQPDALWLQGFAKVNQKPWKPLPAFVL